MRAWARDGNFDRSIPYYLMAVRNAAVDEWRDRRQVRYLDDYDAATMAEPGGAPVDRLPAIRHLLPPAQQADYDWLLEYYRGASHSPARRVQAHTRRRRIRRALGIQRRRSVINKGDSGAA
jgi:hypothetical protein